MTGSFSVTSPSRGGRASEGSAEPFGPELPLVDIEDELPDVAAGVARRARQGDARALDELVRLLSPYIGRICGAIAIDRGDEAMQNAMVAIVQNLGSLREPKAVRGWARRIAVREAVRVAKVDRASPVDPETLATTVPSNRDDVLAVDVHVLLDQLTPEQRAVLVLRHFDGLSEQEMAELLDVAPGTVKSRLARAREAFRRRWSS